MLKSVDIFLNKWYNQENNKSKIVLLQILNKSEK